MTLKCKILLHGSGAKQNWTLIWTDINLCGMLSFNLFKIEEDILAGFFRGRHILLLQHF